MWGGIMLADNPFSELSASVSPGIMQAYVILMAILVLGGTLYDMTHKNSATYFFGHWQKAEENGEHRIGRGRRALLAIQTAAEGLVSGEFCNVRRRIAHLLTMYGFLAYVITTVIMVFRYPTPATPTPALLPELWYLGALMICLGGYWFWFFIRVDVAAEGHSPLRVVRADLFVLSLLASATLALIWAPLQMKGSAWSLWLLGLYLLATTLLFGTVAWSKFSHMFYKPAAAFQRRIEETGGSVRNLPRPAVKPEVFGNARRQPQHY